MHANADRSFSRWWLLPAALLFALAYTQAPLYYSNQNQYYLHGLAQAEQGCLVDDWLANTTDPAPLFSSLVAVTARYFDEYLFHIYYVVIFGIYVSALIGIWIAITQPRPGWLQCYVFLAGLVLAHAALPRWLSCQLFHVDFPWYWQAGLAGQYLLGSMFQPSVFGVFLLVSVCCFLIDRPYTAAAAASLAGILHSTYLLEGAVLVLSYLLVLSREGRWRTGTLASLLALGLVMPSLAYILWHFAPSTPAAAAQARAILVDFRIPHHAYVERWLDLIAWVQILGVIGGILLVRGTRLAPIMLISLLAAAGLTLVQWASDGDFLALLFPWRISTYLVPLATAILIGQLTHWLVAKSAQAAWIGATTLLAVCVGGGIVIMERNLGYLRSPEEVELCEHVRTDLEKGQVYLVPYQLPNLPGPKGSRSSDFVLEDDRSGQRIPVEMQQFRLSAGAPIFVDFKAIPYRDIDVLEWRRRIDVGQQIYADLAAGQLAAARATLIREGITHVVLLRSQEINGRQLQLVYRDPYWVIYRVLPHGSGGS